MGRESYKAVIILLWCIGLASCKKDKPVATINSIPNATGNIYIVCEGNYGNGDATLYAYNAAKDSVYGDLYQQANGQPLGDVFQSMQHIGDKLFLCVNNSDKVVALSASNWSIAGQMAIPDSRYILPISATKAYVSSLYSNKVYIINPQAIAVTDTITLPAYNTEGMCIYNDAAFICTWDTTGNKISKIDLATNKLIQTYTVAGYAPQEALLDKEQRLWILAGDFPDSTPHTIATLTCLDPSTGEVLQSYTFPKTADAIKPVFNKTKDTLYFIEANNFGGLENNGVYRMGIHDATLPAQPFVAAKALQYFWALGIDPVTGNIFIGDPKGFTQKGSVSIYQPNGTLVKTFAVGLGPGHFYFDE